MTSCSPVSGDFECQCQGSWGGETCSVCTLNCNDGHATDDCTQCKCDDNHGGVLCEWSFDTYSVVLGVSIVVIPSEAMGRFKRLFEYDVAFALRIPADRVEVRDVGTMGGEVSVNFRLYVNRGQESQFFYQMLLRQDENQHKSAVLYRGETTQFWKRILCRGEECSDDPLDFVDGIPLSQNEFIAAVGGTVLLLSLRGACCYRFKCMKQKDLTQLKPTKRISNTFSSV